MSIGFRLEIIDPSGKVNRYMSERLYGVPNAFYDLIVFASSTLLFLFGVGLGTGVIQDRLAQGRGASGVDLALLITGLFFFSYEYGRIAEAWSAILIQAPMKLLRERTRFFQSADFLAPMNDVEKSLNITITASGRLT